MSYTKKISDELKKYSDYKQTPIYDELPPYNTIGWKVSANGIVRDGSFLTIAQERVWKEVQLLKLKAKDKQP
jgi:hypothetical protein